MTVAELLRARSSEDKLLAESHTERAPLDDQHFVACQAMAVVGIVLREVAVDLEQGEQMETASSLIGRVKHRRLELTALGHDLADFDLALDSMTP